MAQAQMQELAAKRMRNRKMRDQAAGWLFAAPAIIGFVVLTLLPIFTPAAIPGVTLGCFIANIASFNAVDMIFGTAATLIAALLTYAFRNIKFKGLPLLSMLPPVIINAVVIGLEIAFFFLPEGYTFWGFVISGLQVGLGELAVCYILGIPFYLIVKKHNIFKGLF